MVVLRSRTIAPTTESPPKLRRRGRPLKIEPMTPVQAHELASQQSPRTSSPNPDNDGIGSGSTSASSAAPRRSLRLSASSDPVEESAEKTAFSGSRKRKFGWIENEATPSFVDKGEGLAQVVLAEEVVVGGTTGVAPSTESAREGSGNRNLTTGLNIDLNLIYLSDSDEGEGFINLRSGKSVGRRGLEARDVRVPKGSCDSASLCEGHANDEIVVTGGIRDGAMELLRRAVYEIENGASMGENILRTEEKGKDPMNDNDVARGSLSVNCDGNGEVRCRGRYSALEKGKGLVVESKDLLDNGNYVRESGSKLLDDVVSDDSMRRNNNVGTEAAVQGKGTRVRTDEASGVVMRERFKQIAKRSASRFAHFNGEEVGASNSTVEVERNVEMASTEASHETEDWPGPFSTAMRIIKDREAKMNPPQSKSCLEKSKSLAIKWTPQKGRGRDLVKRVPPSLQDLCLNLLADNADAITSLDGVPDTLRHRLSQLLCDSRRMNTHFFNLLVQGLPTELRIGDCSWLTEEELSKSFSGCDMSSLMVLQLNQCGRCLGDQIISSSLAQPKSLAALSTLSISGACRLTDVGLSALVAAAHRIRSINLSQCTLVTSAGIEILANSLGSVLKELYIDDCQSIDPMLALPALKKFEHLEVLSLVGMQSVCDDFISEFAVIQGHNMKELVLSDCVNLTDASFKVIAETCPGLLSLGIGNLSKLTDCAIGYLANGCLGIQKLILCRNTFGDEALAAFLETSGGQLEELSLNNVRKVGNNTAISLAQRARKLCSLDLSWCRNLTDEAVGLIVDSCLSLKELKVFGCTQITAAFVDGHSNPDVHIIGLSMTPLLEYFKVPVNLGPLRYS